MEYLEAPIPFVIGLTELPSSLNFSLEDKIIVNIQEDTIQGKFLTNTLIELPDQKKLAHLLKPLHKEIKERKIKPNPYKNAFRDQAIILKICEAFRTYHTWLMDEVILKDRINADPDLPFDWDDPKHINELVENLPKTYRPFMRIFLGSQLFASYGDKIKEILRIKWSKNEKEFIRSKTLNNLPTTKIKRRGVSLDLGNWKV